jgi:hypothetical protein
MEPFITVLILLSVTAAVVIACRAIQNRKRQQQTQSKAVAETQATVIAEHPTTTQEPQPTVAEETLLTALAQAAQTTLARESELIEREEKRPPAAEELQPITPEEPQQTVLVEAQPITPEEIEQIVREEAQPGVMQEIQPPATIETQLAAIEKTQSTTAQKTQPEAGEETQRLLTKQVQSIPAGSTQLTPESKKPKPIARGGRPRASTPDRERQQERKTKPRTLKPEIVCWKRERQWILALEVSEELIENSGLTVLQNGSSLSRDESEESCWHLGQVFGEVIARWSEDEGVQEAKVELGHEGYLLFKLSGRDLDQGRLVRFPCSGSYLVVAPEDWERDETLSGPPPVAPEPVFFTGYQAHFFDLKKGDVGKIAFRLPNGQPLVIEAQTRGFELTGRRLVDASKRMGPLFGEGPIRIRALDMQAWRNVATIVVGEEGADRERWRIAFSPNPDEMEQDLPSEVVNRIGGWYFLRFYDNNDDLIESIDFRFLSVLKQINIRQPSVLPAKGEHKPVRVEFLHGPGCTVKPKNGWKSIQVESQDEKTILILPSDPACDESEWIVSAEGAPKVEVTILDTGKLG